ncbi:MAG: VWA domain-containing protein [Kofleriaceae bacterium]
MFVVDVSRSVATSELETEAAVIQSYLAHAPATQVQVVLYARKPRAVFSAWTTAKAASATIAHELATLTEQNGSNVDTGLVEAARWLAATEGTRRVVLFSDDRLGNRIDGLEPEVLRAVLPAHTLIHVVAVDHAPPVGGFAWDGQPVERPSVVRDDGVAFAKLALASEGFSAHAESQDGRADARVLVRPIALEQVSIAGGAWQEGAAPGIARACPHERADGEFRKLDLAEGDSCEWFGEGKGELGALTLHGLLWNHVVERPIMPSPDHGLALARTILGFQMHVEDDVMKEVSLAARAVDQAWSLIATWGGPDGYGDASGGSELAGSYCGCDGPRGMSGFGVGAPLRISGPSLDDQLAKAIAGCRADARVTIDLEFTLNEIVDVAVGAPSTALRDCVTEAVWNAPVFLAKPLPHSTAHVVI